MEAKIEQFGDNPPAIVERGYFTVIVNDSLPPEANAMTMALYSRDPRSYLVHLVEVLKKGCQKFMSLYYVGYGHKSIGDCGSTNVCAEGVSMLCAKAIQDTELYNGQEASTRYMDMKSMRVLNPAGTEAGKLIQTRWMDFYGYVLEKLTLHLKEKYPMLDEDKPAEYEKAIKAKAFDIARGFLPAGCTTFVGWHTNLRQAWDHIYRLKFHPLKEVRETAEAMLEGLRTKYPSSFNHKTYEANDSYQELCGKEHSYAEDPAWGTFHNFGGWFDYDRVLNDSRLLRLLTERPAYSELPKIFKQFGTIRMRGLLDFGSFRDLQRHRGISQTMPLLTLKYGFHEWYLESLPDDLREEAIRFLKVQVELIKDMFLSPEDLQYYIAMGYKVPVQVAGGLPGLVYLLELRSGQTVHATLRRQVQSWAERLQNSFPGMALHCDMGPDQWTTKRGKQDIVRKKEG